MSHYESTTPAATEPPAAVSSGSTDLRLRPAAWDEPLFRQPSAGFRGAPFWSWNGPLDRQRLFRERVYSARCTGQAGGVSVRGLMILSVIAWASE